MLNARPLARVNVSRLVEDVSAGTGIPDATAGIVINGAGMTNFAIPVTGTFNGKNKYERDWPPLGSSCQMLFFAGESGFNGWFFQVDEEGFQNVAYDYSGLNVQYPWLAVFNAGGVTVTKETA
jgi:hypothetical protein